MSKCQINNCYNYTNCINIYNNSNFVILPINRSPIPPPMQIYVPLGACGRPYPTPSYNPPAPCCNGIDKQNCKCAGSCGKC
jgi:hypothetical protein